MIARAKKPGIDPRVYADQKVEELKKQVVSTFEEQNAPRNNRTAYVIDKYTRDESNDRFVPYTGADKNVDLGTYSISAGNGSKLSDISIDDVSAGALSYTEMSGVVAGYFGLKDYMIIRGVVGNPTLAFINSDATIISTISYDYAADTFLIGGVGLNITNNITVLDLNAGDGIISMLTLSHRPLLSLSPTGVGDGCRVDFKGLKKEGFLSTTPQDYAYIDLVCDDNEKLTSAGSIRFHVDYNSTIAEKMRLSGTGKLTVTGEVQAGEMSQIYSGTITRDGSGYITQVARTGGKTYVITRDGNNYVSSFTDGTKTWTLTRDGNNRIASWAVT